MKRIILLGALFAYKAGNVWGETEWLVDYMNVMSDTNGTWHGKGHSITLVPDAGALNGYKEAEAQGTLCDALRAELEAANVTELANLYGLIDIGVEGVSKRCTQWNTSQLPLPPSNEPPCAFGYCMGQTMEGEPDSVAYDGLFQTFVDDQTFDKMGIHWAPDTGVCEIVGYADISMFDTFAAILTRKYGAPTIDHGDDGKVWKQTTAGFKEKGTVTAGQRAGVIYRFANYDACLEEVQADLAERF